MEAIARALWIANGNNPLYWDNPPSNQWVAHMNLERKPDYRERAEKFLKGFNNEDSR
jgi:hypothetical protein